MEKVSQCGSHSSYHSLNIIRVMKSRRLGGAGHVARMEEGKHRCEANIRMDLKAVGFPGFVLPFSVFF